MEIVIIFKNHHDQEELWILRQVPASSRCPVCWLHTFVSYLLVVIIML